jgi:hypothetical protein
LYSLVKKIRKGEIGGKAIRKVFADSLSWRSDEWQPQALTWAGTSEEGGRRFAFPPAQ